MVSRKIRANAIPVRKRIIYASETSTTEQSYGKKGQKIWSVSRTDINKQLLDLADAEENINISFEQRLVQIDFNSACCTLVKKVN